MPSGGQGNFAGTGGFNGQFPGFGGAGAGYTGGYGNPSSVGGGTAGQTYAGQAYANTLNKYNPTLANYSGVSGPSAAQNAQQQAVQKQIKAQQGNISAAARQAALDANAAQLGPAVVASTTEQPPNYWGSGAGPVYGGPPVPGGFGGFNESPGSVWNGPQWQGNTPSPNYEGGGPTGSGGYGGGKQFGGPVAPGRQYTVGENGPETLQMRPGGGGRVIPNNPADRRVALANALQGRVGGGGGITGLNRAAPAPMPLPAPPAVRPAMPPGAGMRPPSAPVSGRMGGWQG